MTMILDGTAGITFPDNSQQYNSYYGFKNRIINGAMVIDQRNAGASVTATGGFNVYTLDRWNAVYSVGGKFSVEQNISGTAAPAGFTSYLGVTSLSAYSVGSSEQFNITQSIEGFNWSDMGWGAAGAQSTTLSFWVRSSLTGTFGGVIKNASNNRAYPYTYTISSANTWEYKTVTIPGDTSGTWATDNSVGATLVFNLGAGATVSATAGSWTGTSNIFAPTGAVSVVGTNGATFYITGVQLEKGSTATSFDYRPYGTELALCQRYFSRLGSGGWGYIYSSTNADAGIQFPVTMRSTPSVTHLANYGITLIATADYTVTNTVINANASNSVNGLFVRLTSTGMSTGNMCIATNNNIGLSSEL